jgi:hypothetical protein
MEPQGGFSNLNRRKITELNRPNDGSSRDGTYTTTSYCDVV